MKRKVVNMPVLLRKMQAAGLDAAVVASPENFFYLSGWKIQTQVLIRDRLALGIVTADGALTLVVCKNEETQTRRYASVEDIRTYAEFIDSPMKGVAEVLLEKGLAASRIGIERKYVTVDYFEDLQQRVPATGLTSCDKVFDRCRSERPNTVRSGASEVACWLAGTEQRRPEEMSSALDVLSSATKGGAT